MGASQEIQLTKIEACQTLEDREKLLQRIKDISYAIELLLSNGLLRDNLKGKIIDCCAGIGTGEHVLRRYGGEVTFVEKDPEVIQKGITMGLLRNKTQPVDCFTYLKTVEPESVNLITNFAVTNFFDISTFHRLAERCLKKGGQLIITAGYDSRRAIDKIKDKGKLLTHEDWTKHRFETFIYLYTKE